MERSVSHASGLTEKDKEKVVELGGLHVIGTERHEARRIDNQLRGRAGRQGDPGSSHFFVSLEDELMRRMGNKGLLDRVWQDEEMVIEHSFVAKAIEQSQVKMEGYNFDLRKHLLEYDDVINKQREVIYGQRRKILSTNSLKPLVLDMVHDELHSMVATYLAGNYRDAWDLAGLANAVRIILPLTSDAVKEWEDKKPDEIEEYLIQVADEEYEIKKRRWARRTCSFWDGWSC